MNIQDFIKQSDKLYMEMNSIYHNTAVKFGLSDTAMWILYLISDKDSEYTQQDLVKQCYFPKQTINTSLKSLVKNGYAELEETKGAYKRKLIRLTERGQALASAATDRLKIAEINAYGSLSDNELTMYLEITSKINRILRDETDNL